MVKKKILPLAITLCLVLTFQVSATNVNAQQFHQGDMTTENFNSPARLIDANGLPTIDDWRHINSAWNQPRNVGTNPHEGTDLRMGPNEPVYSVFNGIVEQKGSDWLLIKRTDQNVYMVYKHINPKVNEGDLVYTNTEIATIQDITHDHLHIGLTTNNTSYYNDLIWAANNRPFDHVNVDNWKYGKGTDFLKRHFLANGHILEIYAFASDNEGKNIKPEQVYLWHRDNGTSTWNGPVSMQWDGTTNYKYSYDFGDLGYYNNQSVDFLVVGYRAGTFDSGKSNWAYYPAYYASPSETPDSNSKYYTVTLSNLPEPI